MKFIDILSLITCINDFLQKEETYSETGKVR